MNNPNEIHLLSRNLAAQHLTDAQFTDLLLGAIPASVTAHLEACPQCAQEAQRVSGAIGSFQQQSRLWAEHRVEARRSALRPLETSAHQPLLAWLNRPAAWTAAAAALVLATVFGIGNLHRSDRSAASQHPAQQQIASLEPAPALVPEAAPQASPATLKSDLKSDNDLLSAINGELSAEAAPPAGMYGLKVATPVSRAKSLKRMSN